MVVAMDTLDGSEWDVVIIGTGFAESLLALSLSRSGKQILHLDRNDYYGGDEAALSLAEAETWADRYAPSEHTSTFSHAAVHKADEGEGASRPRLASSRAYSVALAPHLIYSRSNLISTIVSSRLHNQLDFQAVGSWFVLEATSDAQSLVKVPGGREDVFADKSLGLKATRALMKFLRFVAEYEEKTEVWEAEKDTPFPTFLERKFGLPQASIAPILALTMSESAPSETATELALSRIARHARSIGAFGPGFAAVLPKWGGLAEIDQVACRACAVGGGVYVLDKGVEKLTRQDGDHSILLELSGGEKIRTHWTATSRPTSTWIGSQKVAEVSCSRISKSVSIVSSSLASLFPPTSEGGVAPAGAVVVIPSSSDADPPVYIIAHTSEAGECPTGQCVLYASVAVHHDDGGFPRLDQSVQSLLQSVDEDPHPVVLWSLQYTQDYSSRVDTLVQDGVIALPPLSSDLTLADEVLASVKHAWQQISGDGETAFMVFEAREDIGEDDA